MTLNRDSIGLYLELAKARLTGLVALTTAAGFLLACRGDWDLWTLFWTVIGTGLAGGGSNGLNQWRESNLDGQMDRTRMRPLPSGRISPQRAFRFSVALSTLGVGILAAFVNGLTALLGAVTVLLYVLVYTPLKTQTSLCTLVGAVCGAIPPMMGWTGAVGQIESGAWILAAILFVWQIPHFLALAWLYRADYLRGGFRMLPVVDPHGALTCHAVVLYCIALLPVALTLSLVGVTGWLFAVGSVVLGGMFLSLGMRLYRQRTDREARRVFLGSLIYLSLLMALMVADRLAPPLGVAEATGISPFAKIYIDIADSLEAD
ncbi:MAG: protoheme IX farnesyltransferase [Candidatus Omnitrophica bacterium]|nr:protoheme IX farnesyltransferase [Candidatus Omnitrophota bacterium]